MTEEQVKALIETVVGTMKVELENLTVKFNALKTEYDDATKMLRRTYNGFAHLEKLTGKKILPPGTYFGVEFK